MAQIINMPRLSDTMEEGVVAKWLVGIGDEVKEGDILAEIETDKATMEFESFHEGTLLHIGINEGQTAAVDTLLAIVGEKDEDITAIINGDTNTGGQLDLVDQINETEKIENKPKVSQEISSESNDFQIIKMPRLSDTMEEGTVSSWLVGVGDEVKEGDILAEIETDKATMEFESFYEGTLLYIGINEGQTAVVDSLLAIIGDKSADFNSAIENFEKVSSDDVVSHEENEIPAEINEDFSSKNVGTSSSNSRILASPLAKKIASKKNIDLSTIQGSGDNGRITKVDVENYKVKEKEISELVDNRVSQSVSATQKSIDGSESFEEIENSQMRKAIARRLKESKFSAPHYYLNIECDMDNAITFRKQYNTLPNTKISFNDIVVKACAIALKQHPKVNSQWFEDKMRLNNHVHIGVAVGVTDGLVVPVIRFANEKSLTKIGSEVKDFASKSKDKKLSPNDMEGSTFTVSNLGMFGISDFTSIINQPNSAILSVGSIVQKPVVKENKIEIGNIMKLTLACDHRSVDGVTGSLFLETLKGFIENPVTMLV
jgi:pyruvate dehydrogenase E2 component (dihydrolipoamide acetyltransferase)